MAFEGGPKKVAVVGGPVNFYERYTATNLYSERSFGCEANTITISNESTTDTISISFDGATLEAEVYANESITLNTDGQSSIYARGAAGGDDVRIWGW